MHFPLVHVHERSISDVHVLTISDVHALRLSHPRKCMNNELVTVHER